MKRTILALFATLTIAGNAHAQAWPNATPSPYGAATAPHQAAAPAPIAAAPPAPTMPTGEELGAPPHVLGAVAPASTSNVAALPVSSEPAVPDSDNPEGGRATAALNVLEAQGYAAFSNFRPSGSNYTALVTDNGQQFQVVVDPETGRISRQ